jgi:hypothetical protein
MKKFVLVRGKDTGLLYLYDRETYKFMKKSKSFNYGHDVLEFVVDNDDHKELEQMQALVNKDLLREE